MSRSGAAYMHYTLSPSSLPSFSAALLGSRRPGRMGGHKKTITSITYRNQANEGQKMINPCPLYLDTWQVKPPHTSGGSSHANGRATPTRSYRHHRQSPPLPSSRLQAPRFLRVMQRSSRFTWHARVRNLSTIFHH